MGSPAAVVRLLLTNGVLGAGEGIMSQLKRLADQHAPNAWLQHSLSEMRLEESWV